MNILVLLLGLLSSLPALSELSIGLGSISASETKELEKALAPLFPEIHPQLTTCLIMVDKISNAPGSSLTIQRASAAAKCHWDLVQLISPSHAQLKRWETSDQFSDRLYVLKMLATAGKDLATTVKSELGSEGKVLAENIVKYSAATAYRARMRLVMLKIMSRSARSEGNHCNSPTASVHSASKNLSFEEADLAFHPNLAPLLIAAEQTIECTLKAIEIDDVYGARTCLSQGPPRALYQLDPLAYLEHLPRNKQLGAISQTHPKIVDWIKRYGKLHASLLPPPI